MLLIRHGDSSVKAGIEFSIMNGLRKHSLRIYIGLDSFQSFLDSKYLLGLDILARPLGVLHLYTYTTPVLHLLTPINFLVWVENITCFFT